MEKIAIIAFDIEARGKSPERHGILAVGCVVGLTDGTVLHKQTWKVAPLSQVQTFEPRCMEEFWNKNPELLQRLETNPQSPLTFAQEFRSFLNFWEKTHTLYLLCDNPTFDAGFINYYLDFFGFDSMQYGFDGKTYRLVHDSDSYARGRIHASFNNQWLNDKDACQILFNHDACEFSGTRHDPADDAEHIFKMHCLFVNK